MSAEVREQAGPVYWQESGVDEAGMRLVFRCEATHPADVQVSQAELGSISDAFRAALNAARIEFQRVRATAR